MSTERTARDRRRDFWQLDVPLVLVLLLCATLTVVEAFRAQDGVWRAWVYLVEWPVIGLGAVWIWRHYRLGAGRPSAEVPSGETAPPASTASATAATSATATVEKPKRRPFGAGLVEHYQARTEAITREYDETHKADPGLDAWSAYQAELARTQPPVGPQH